MSQIVQTKLMIRTGKGNLIKAPVTLCHIKDRIEFLKSPFALRHEIKAMAGSRWHGYIEGDKPRYHYQDVEPPKSWRPVELGYAPFALAISSPEKNWEVWEGDKLKGYTWPAVIDKFIQHWATNEPAREYARDDVLYTRALDEHFDFPEPGDDDSILACMVPVVRWRGFKIDIPGIKELLARAQDVVARSPVNVNKPAEVRAYLGEWRKTDIKVMRRPGRIQTAGGAVSSALYGAAFGIQAANMRAAANHEIQSLGIRVGRVETQETTARNSCERSSLPASQPEQQAGPTGVAGEIRDPYRKSSPDEPENLYV